MPMPYSAHQTAAICIFNNYAVRIIINKCLMSLYTIKLAVQQTVIFPPPLKISGCEQAKKMGTHW